MNQMNKNKDQFYLASLLYGLGIRIEDFCNGVSKEDIGLIEYSYALALGKKNSEISSNVQRNALVPILETIGKDSISSYEYSVPIAPLSLTKDSFPRKVRSEKKDCSKVLASLMNDLQSISIKQTKAFADSLLCLIERYTLYVPYSAEEVTDISMFDYIKTSSAIAMCLHDEITNDTAPFLLVGADFSGIQSYIYQIVSKHAGKNLKGRSFYVRLLSDAVVRFMLKKLGLFKVNVIYNSGGGFYLIAPNTPIVKQRIKEATEEIEKQFFNIHGTAIYAAIDYVELSTEILCGESTLTLSDVWGNLFRKRDKQKSHKFASLITNAPLSFFDPAKQGGDVITDSITGEEIAKDESHCTMDNLILKPSTKVQIDLGKVLKDIAFIVCADHAIKELDTVLNIEPANLGVHYYFLNSSECDKINNIRTQEVNIVAINGVDFDWLSLKTAPNISFSSEYYGGNEFNGKTFDKMSSGEELDRLGVLRMDVDNLGNIFQKGIPAERANLSRFTALSRSFDYFFSGYLNTIWKETSPNNTFIIYSGGDDVFIVGRWDKTVEIAKRIREDFKDFTCNNPMFSISGGVAIVRPKFPLMKAAEQSGKEEKNAKEHLCGSASKNSLSFMSMPLNWHKEFPAVESLKNTLVSLLSGGKLPSSFLSKIMQHHACAAFEEHKIKNVKTYWMLTYDLSRMSGRLKDAEAKAIINNCKKETISRICDTLNLESISTDYHPLELWAMACRWAELVTRTE